MTRADSGHTMTASVRCSNAADSKVPSLSAYQQNPKGYSSVRTLTVDY